MKKLIFSFAIIFSTILSAPSVSAHVLITNTTKTNGAVLHITPDDDPVAGKQSTFYFDTQNKTSLAPAEVQLTVTDQSGIITAVETTVEGSLIMATYTFPSQGVYDINYTLKSNDTVMTFTQAQRVSRGITSSETTTMTHEWAEIALLLAIIGFVMLSIIAFNRRKEIIKHSTF